MRARFHSVLAVLVASILTLAVSAPARAVVVQGFEVTAGGAANTSALMMPGNPHSDLLISNIGSTGNDWAEWPLHRGSGTGFTFEQTSAEPLVRREFTLYENGVFPGDKVPIIKGTALRTPTGSTRYLECLIVNEITVEVWDNGSRVIAVALPTTTEITLHGSSDVTASGTHVLAYGGRQGSTGAVKNPRRVMMVENLPAPCDITVGGTTVNGDQLVFEVVSDALPEQFDGAQLGLSTNIGAVLNGSVVIGDLTLVRPKYDVTLVLSSDPVADALGDDMLHGTDAEPGALTYSLTGGGPGGGGGGGIVRLQSASCRYWDTQKPEWSERKWTIDLNPDAPYSVEMEVEADDHSGLPPAKYVFTVVITTSPTTMIAMSSTIPGDEITAQAFSLGRPVGQPSAAGLGTHVQCSTAPIGWTTSGAPGSSSIEIEFPAGTTFQMGGQVFTGNMLHMHSVSTHSRRISDVRIVHPPGSPPGTWRLTNVQGSTSPQAGETGGRGVIARGPRQTVSLDGSYASNDKRLGVRDACDLFKGQLKFLMGGATSIAIEPRPEPGEPEPELSSLELYDCLDDGCDPSRSLEVARTVGSVQIHATATYQDGSSMFVQAGSSMLPMSVADPDGDGVLVLSPTSAIEPRIILKSYRWLSPQAQCFKLEFSEPVQFATGLGTRITKSLVWWGYHDNPEGFLIPMAAVSLNQLPPGTPWTAWKIAPPMVHCSGSATQREDVPITRGGHQVVSTWGTAYGNVVIAGDTDGDLELQRGWPLKGIAFDDPPVFEAYATNPACPGFVSEMDTSPPGLIWSPRSNIFLYGSGRIASQPSDVTTLHGLTIEYGGGLDPVLRYAEGAAGSHPVVHLYQGPTEVGSAPVDEVTINNAPGVVVMNDSDGDGYGDIVAGGFPPGTTASLSGMPATPVTRIAFSPSQDLETVAGYAKLGWSLAGLPPGIPVMGDRISQIVVPGSTVDVPPAAPNAGLEFRGVMPNPARGASTVRLALGRESRIRVQVLDVAGREIARLADGVRPAGEHAFTWSGVSNRGSKAGAGLYFVRVSGDGLPTHTARMIRLD